MDDSAIKEEMKRILKYAKEKQWDEDTTISHLCSFLKDQLDIQLLTLEAKYDIVR